MVSCPPDSQGCGLHENLWRPKNFFSVGVTLAAPADAQLSPNCSQVLETSANQLIPTDCLQLTSNLRLNCHSKTALGPCWASGHSNKCLLADARPHQPQSQYGSGSRLAQGLVEFFTIGDHAPIPLLNSVAKADSRTLRRAACCDRMHIQNAVLRIESVLQDLNLQSDGPTDAGCADPCRLSHVVCCPGPPGRGRRPNVGAVAPARSPWNGERRVLWGVPAAATHVPRFQVGFGVGAAGVHGAAGAH
mmetsp:Transcript_17637/g.27912  ORF Transcript_17637/g.27912 Transcript_17637/m.27912 type:complete len:247 (-) Transcript_17637:1064-1804(-)